MYLFYFRMWSGFRIANSYSSEKCICLLLKRWLTDCYVNKLWGEGPNQQEQLGGSWLFGLNDDDGLDQSSGGLDGEAWSDSGYNIKVESIVLSWRVECEMR